MGGKGGSWKALKGTGRHFKERVDGFRRGSLVYIFQQFPDIQRVHCMKPDL